MLRRLPLAVTLAFAACAAAHADFHAEYAATQGADQSVPSLSRIELSGDRARMDFGRASVLFAGDKLTALLHGRKRFVDLQKTAAIETKNSEAVAAMSSSQRAAAEQRPNAHVSSTSPTGTLKAKATGKSDKVNGIPCETYRIEFDGRHVQDICLAGFADAGIPAQDAEALQHVFERLTALNERRSASTYRSALAFVPEGKFPVRISVYLLDGRFLLQTVELKQVAGGGGSANDYVIPAGYKEATSGAAAIAMPPH